MAPRPITGQFSTGKCIDTNYIGVLVLPMLSQLLLTDCCLVHEWLKEIKVGFSYSQLVTSCLPVDLSVCHLPSSFESLNYFPLTFSLDGAVLRYYSGIKIILCQLIDIHLKKGVFIDFENINNFFLTSF